MRPFLWDGWELLLVPVGWSEIRPGDLAYFLGPQGPTLHRVLSLQSGYLIARGDAESRSQRIDRQHVLGRASAVRIGGRWFRLGQAQRRGGLAWHRFALPLALVASKALRRLRGRGSAQR